MDKLKLNISVFPTNESFELSTLRQASVTPVCQSKSCDFSTKKENSKIP